MFIIICNNMHNILMLFINILQRILTINVYRFSGNDNDSFSDIKKHINMQVTILT